MFTRKDRKIANLKVMVENRDKLIADQEATIMFLRKTIDSLKEILTSLENDNKALLEQAYKTAKKPKKKEVK